MPHLPASCILLTVSLLLTATWLLPTSGYISVLCCQSVWWYVGGRGRVDDSLDPMDPAAYSDVPRYHLHIHKYII